MSGDRGGPLFVDLAARDPDKTPAGTPILPVEPLDPAAELQRGIDLGFTRGWEAAKAAAYLAILSVHDPIGCPPAVAALLGSQAAAIRALLMPPICSGCRSRHAGGCE